MGFRYKGKGHNLDGAPTPVDRELMYFRVTISYRISPKLYLEPWFGFGRGV